MHSSLRRAIGFAIVGLLAVPGPFLGATVALPFALIAFLAIVVSGGPLFELFARPGDRTAGRLRGLFGVAVSAATLGVLAGYSNLPMTAFTAAVLIVMLGNLGAEIIRVYTTREPTLGDLIGGLIGAVIGQGVVIVAGDAPFGATFLTLALAGALLGALIRSMLFARDEPPVMFSVAFLLWLLLAVDIAASIQSVALAVLVAGGLGVIAYVIDAASIEGMIAGVLLGILTIVLGGYAWFVLLVAFFGVGGGFTKFRYEQKLEHGVAEQNGGARGGENVLANSGAAMAGLFSFALVDAGLVSGDPTLSLFVFAGALATALSDTLASEVGGSYGRTRLITTLEPVPPGTDGGITWQGLFAGVAGATIIGGLALDAFGAIETPGTVLIVFAGISGMMIDSLLGATLEGKVLGNGSVNFIATLSGGFIAGLLAIGIGLASLPPL